MIPAEPAHTGTVIRIGVVTAYVRAIYGINADQGMRAARTRLMASPGQAVPRVLPVERRSVIAAPCALAGGRPGPLIVTAGVAAPSPPDVPPGAMDVFCVFVPPGFSKL